jgi:hypothetical protein
MENELKALKRTWVAANIVRVAIGVVFIIGGLVIDFLFWRYTVVGLGVLVLLWAISDLLFFKAGRKSYSGAREVTGAEFGDKVHNCANG